MFGDEGRRLPADDSLEMDSKTRCYSGFLWIQSYVVTKLATPTATDSIVLLTIEPIKI